MQFNVQIDPAQVNEAIAQAIVNSALGPQLQEAINAALRRALSDGYGNAGVVQAVVVEEVRRLVLEVLHSEPHQAKLREAVRSYVEERLTGEVLKEVVGKLWDEYTRR